MKLLTNGCSFTHGWELSDPKKSWPHVLGNNISADTTNLAMGGASNARIFRTTIEYLNTNLPPDLVVIGWTVFSRAELSYHQGTYLRLTSKNCMPDTKEIQDYDDFANIHRLWTTALYNPYISYRDWLHTVVHLQEYFKTKGINYLFFSALDENFISEFANDAHQALLLADRAWQWRDRSYEPLMETHKEYHELKNLAQKIDLDQWILCNKQTMQEYLHSRKYQADSTGHFLEDGHQEWANVIQQHIQ